MIGHGNTLIHRVLHFNFESKKRNPEIVEYLKSCSVIGKFGVPQAKWRNGTYGINSKEPDPFYIFKSTNK
jgi:hypothetical protein